MESLVVNPAYWKNRRVFLTGHTGFKGSWLSLWLQHMGATVCGYALQPSTSPNLFSVANIEPGMTSIIADIRDQERLRQAIQSFEPEVVFHLAAQALVRDSYDDPVGTYATNVMGSLHLLEAVRQTPGVRSVIIITSDKCYENHEWPWPYRETDPMGGYDPYSSSKACTELLTASYRRSFFSDDAHQVGLATTRAGNVIGGGDWAHDRLIPDLIRALSAGEQAEIRNPAAIRPWQHVLDPLAGYLLLAEKMSDQTTLSEAWNFGPESSDAKPVQWISDYICKLWSTDASWTCNNTSNPHEAGVLKLDSSKARTLLGWQPRFNLAQALRLTTDWYRACTEGQDMQALSREQINQYLARESD